MPARSFMLALFVPVISIVASIESQVRASTSRLNRAIPSAHKVALIGKIAVFIACPALRHGKKGSCTIGADQLRIELKRNEERATPEG